MGDSFDPTTLEAALGALSDLERRLFATVVATRVQGGFAAYVAEGGDREQAATLEAALDHLWSHAVGGGVAQPPIDACEPILSTESELWEWHRPWAEGAVLATIAALRTLETATASIAVQPAVHAVEALDLRIIYDLRLDMNIAASEEAVANHPAMQRELARQKRDLEEIAPLTAQVAAGQLEAMRARAREEAADSLQL